MGLKERCKLVNHRNAQYLLLRRGRVQEIPLCVGMLEMKYPAFKLPPGGSREILVDARKLIEAAHDEPFKRILDFYDLVYLYLNRDWLRLDQLGLLTCPTDGRINAGAVWYVGR